MSVMVEKLITAEEPNSIYLDIFPKQGATCLKPIWLTLYVVSVATLVAVLAASGKIVNTLWIDQPPVQLRVSTAVTAALCFALVLSLQDKIRAKSVYYAFLAVIFWLGLYEIVWYYTAVPFYGYDLRLFEFAGLFGWVLLGVKEVYHTRPPKIAIALYGVFALTMGLWVAAGFRVNFLEKADINMASEAFNVVSKGALAFAFALHIGQKK
jgi:hypothetical protein